MAGNKHRSGEDNFLKYIIIGFGVAIVGLVILGIVLSSLEDEPEVPLLDYDDFQQVSHFDLISEYDDEIFGVYYYSESCPSCINLKPRLLEFASSNALDMPIYLMDAYGTLGDKTIVVGPLGEQLQYTPTLLIYTNGVLTQFIVGSDEIDAFINITES